MNYDTIENLAAQAKLGDTKAKESLVKEFAPLILNLSKKSFINSYEFEDIKNECYKTLFKCVNMYNRDKHRFVAYATNAIKNSVNHLIRISVRRSGAEGTGAFSLNDKLENSLYIEVDEIDSILLSGFNKASLQAVIKKLKPSDQDLINHIIFKGYSLKKYSEFKGIPYATTVIRKANVLKKLRKDMTAGKEDKYMLN